MDDRMDSYKTQHEAFVSDHHGSTFLEIILVCAISPLSVFLRDVAVLSLDQNITGSSWRIFLLDFICLVLPILLSCTMFSSCLECQIITMLLVGLLLVSSKNRRFLFNFVRELQNQIKSPDTLVTRHMITEYRAFANIATAVFILAVDFNVFPRRFCKTETYGTGLMDIGVGGFVVVNGVVSAEARWKYQYERTLQSKMKQLLHSIKSTLPLWILGVLRVLAVKSSDYHEHVTEYGVHWNFFFTLAMVKILSSLILFIFPVTCSWILSIVIICSYEYLLVAVNLKEFILNGSDGTHRRANFLEANREGIFSNIGYLSLYLASVGFGQLLANTKNDKHPYMKCCTVLILDIILWIVLHFITPLTLPISRRMANLSYVLWMMAFNILLMCSFFITSTGNMCFYGKKDNRWMKLDFLEAVNRNGLSFFLLANVLTGLVNMSMKTIFVSQFVAYTTLICYMFMLSLAIWWLHLKQITLKFW